MLKRRDFIKQTVAVATIAPGVINSAHATSTAVKHDAAKSLDIALVIYDEQFADSVAFAEALSARGARAFAVGNDIGRLWFGELGSIVASHVAIAGLTTHSDLHVSLSFARQFGSRLQFEAEHDCRGGEFLTHRIRTRARAQSMDAVFVHADTRWPQALAASLSNYAGGTGALRELKLSTSINRDASHPGSLFSWVIA